MIKTIIVKQIEDDANVYRVDDYIRIKLNPKDLNKPERASEYIGTITDITKNSITICNNFCTRELLISDIDKMRFAKDGETFDNTWNFEEVY